MSTWSLSGRLTRYVIATTVGTVVVCAGLSAWFLQGAVEREVDALVHEELEEMMVKLSGGPLERSRFESIAGELAAEHPANPMGWCIAHAEGSYWSEIGPDYLLDAARAAARDSAGEVDKPLAIGLRPYNGQFTIALALDATPQHAVLKRYGGMSLLLVGAFGLVAIAGGALFSRTVGKRMEDVSSWIRRQTNEPLSELGGEMETESAPAEIHGIATALTDLLRTVRAERERAGLLMMGMAHELRSPIQNLLGQTEIALLRERSGEEYRDLLASQLEELRRFGRAVDNLVTLCATEQSDVRGSRENFDLGAEASLRLASDVERAQRANVQLDVHYSGNLEIQGDREALLLALGNLVGNAIDWSPPGTRSRVELSAINGAVHITVDDSGPGVPESEREQIFEPFYHGSSPDGTRVGFGLGLALTRSAVLAHGGTVQVSTSPLGGARFELVLPRAEANYRSNP